MRHPLTDLLQAAARDRMPPADGAVRVLPAVAGPVDAVLSFTAHHVIVADVAETAVLAQLRGDGSQDGLGAPMGPGFLSWLAAVTGSRPGTLDVVLVCEQGEPDDASWLVARHYLLDHARVRRAVRYRTDVSVFADGEGNAVLMLGRGLAGSWEVAFEVEPAWRNRGLAKALLEAAPGLVPGGEPLFAQTAPGNAASLRALLTAGFRPIGGEVLLLKSRRA